MCVMARVLGPFINLLPERSSTQTPGLTQAATMLGGTSGHGLWCSSPTHPAWGPRMGFTAQIPGHREKPGATSLGSWEQPRSQGALLGEAGLGAVA